MNIIFLALLCLPVIEIAVLISVGGAIGLPLTVFFVLLTAVIGTMLLRQQGLALLFSAQRELEQGLMPTMIVIEGFAVAVGGALLLTPGFLTDTIGFLCLIPLTRQLMVSMVKTRFVRTMASQGQGEGVEAQKPHTATGSDVIEGEYKRDE